MRYKETTGQVRAELDQFALDKWKELTRFTNLTGRVNAELRAHIGPELLTNAWAKMFELLSTFDLLPAEQGPR